MPSRAAVAQILWGSKEVWWASRAASTVSKATSKEGSKSAAATATPAAPAPFDPPARATLAAGDHAPATKTRTKRAPPKVKTEPKLLPVSPTLRQFMGGVAESTRAKAVKHLWDYVRAHHLQDPANKTIINCDGKLKAVLGKDQVSLTEVFSLLSLHFPKKEVNKEVKKS